MLAGSRPISSQQLRITGSASRRSACDRPSTLSSSAKRAASRQVTFGPLPPTMIGMRGSCIPFGLMASRTEACSPSKVACSRPGASMREITQPVAQHLQPHASREAIAVGQPLVALPAGADAQLEAPVAGIQRAGHLGRQRWVAKAVADHDLPDPHAFGQRRQSTQRGEGLERDLVRRLGDGEVVEEPDRLEAVPRPAALPPRCAARATPGSHSVVLTGPPLGRYEPNVQGKAPNVTQGARAAAASLAKRRAVAVGRAINSSQSFGHVPDPPTRT